MPSEYPIGAIISFSGNQNAGAGWLLCDGRSLERSSYQPLFDAIGTSNGGDGTTFRLPDYRGRFLRGRDGGAKRDPEAAKRTEAAPGGATGDKVGSYQTGATAKPNTGFATDLPHLPNDIQDVAATAIGWTLAKWKGDSRTVTLDYTGGGTETRPANVALRYFIYVGV
ncbi:MAG: Tail Collar domain protein [Chthonomonadaceae bacterium]|nr:Tail Collar domain protein [Chthonomonadaceae bacterium]